MPQFVQNDPTPANRRMSAFMYEDDGVTPAPQATAFTGVAARRKLSGTTGALISAVAISTTVGVAGNSVTLKLIADGVGSGTIGAVGPAVTFHYQTGVTTVSNLIAALATLGISLGGSFTVGATLTAGDAFGPFTFAGGVDTTLTVRQGAFTRIAAGGTLTNTGLDGDWIYEASQAEINYVGSEFGLYILKPPDPAFLDLSTKTTHVDTIIYDKTAIGSAGNATTIAFANTGAGAGTLDESLYPIVTFKYATGTTTVANFEAAIVASTNFGIKAYGTWTNVLASPADTFAAAALGGGLSYKQSVFVAPFARASFDSVGEGSHTYGDLIRLLSGVISGPVANFTSGTLIFKSLDGTKTRVTVTTDSTGRLTVTLGDLT